MKIQRGKLLSIVPMAALFFLSAQASGVVRDYHQTGVACVAKDPDNGDITYHSSGAVANTSTSATRSILCPINVPSSSMNTGDSVHAIVYAPGGGDSTGIYCTLKVTRQDDGSTLASTAGYLDSAGEGGYSIYASGWGTSEVGAHLNCSIPRDNGTVHKIYGFSEAAVY